MAGKWSWVKGDLEKILVMGTPVVRADLEELVLLVRLLHRDPGGNHARYLEGAWHGKIAKVACHVKNVTKDTCSRYTIFLLLFAVKVLQALGFGLTAMTLSIPWKSAGQQSWLQNFPCQAAVLALLQISDKSTPILAAQVGPRRRAQTSGVRCARRQFFVRG